MSKETATQLIELAPPSAGFRHFIGAWLYQGQKNVIIDVGPANTSGSLLRQLAAAGVNRIDYVLLTHIHIDHAGGLAFLLERYPMAQAICHERAVKHLTAPSKLWSASRQTLGEIAEIYGPPEPVSIDRLIPHTQARVPGLHIIDTPGHASHHLAYCWEGGLFAGEAAGNFYALKDTEYLRPATPPRFYRDVLLASLDQLATLDDQPIYYAHLGRTSGSREMLKRFRAQIMRWDGLIRKEMDRYGKDIADRCVETLLQKDPELKAFADMDRETQQRESYFIRNSVKGFLGFLST